MSQGLYGPDGTVFHRIILEQGSRSPCPPFNRVSVRVSARVRIDAACSTSDAPRRAADAFAAVPSDGVEANLPVSRN